MADNARMDARRTELAGLKVGALRTRAKSVGADMGCFERAVDEEDKGAMVELILDAMAKARSELGGLKIGALRKRARKFGADMKLVEDAVDEEDKGAIVELIVDAMSTVTGLGGSRE